MRPLSVALRGAAGVEPRATAAGRPTWAPRLSVARGGRVRLRGAGGFQWVVHDGGTAFLAGPLAGLSGGESVVAHVRCEDAWLAVTTQGPQVLLETDAPAQHVWSWDVRDGATAWFLPWTTIPLPRSEAVLRTTARVADGAALALWDVLAAGRVARGERFAMRSLLAEIAIEGPRGPLIHERTLLRGADRRHHEPLMGGWTHMASLYLVGFAGLAPAAVRELLEHAGGVFAGVSSPCEGLLAVRALGASGDELEQALWPVLDAAADARGVARPRAERLARRWARDVTRSRPKGGPDAPDPA